MSIEDRANDDGDRWVSYDHFISDIQNLLSDSLTHREVSIVVHSMSGEMDGLSQDELHSMFCGFNIVSGYLIKYYTNKKELTAEYDLHH